LYYGLIGDNVNTVTAGSSFIDTVIAGSSFIDTYVDTMAADSLFIDTVAAKKIVSRFYSYIELIKLH